MNNKMKVYFPTAILLALTVATITYVLILYEHFSSAETFLVASCIIGGISCRHYYKDFTYKLSCIRSLIFVVPLVVFLFILMPWLWIFLEPYINIHKVETYFEISYINIITSILSGTILMALSEKGFDLICKRLRKPID